MVTDEDNIVERSDGVAWTQWGPSPSASGGGLALVERKLITAHATTVTFSGLDGNTDEVYRLIMRLLNKAGASVKYVMNPNGETTNLSSNFAYNGLAGVNAATWQLSSNTAADLTDNNWANYSVDIWAKNDPNSIAAIRQYHGDLGVATTTPAAARGQFSGVWNETSSNLTSLDIVSSVANGIGNGSTLVLYKYAQS